MAQNKQHNTQDTCRLLGELSQVTTTAMWVSLISSLKCHPGDTTGSKTNTHSVLRACKRLADGLVETRYWGSGGGGAEKSLDPASGPREGFLEAVSSGQLPFSDFKEE